MTDSRPRLCVLGSINMDLVVRAPRLPAPGETLLGGPFETHPGGKGANQAVAAARLGADVSFIGAVGDDVYGRTLRRVLESESIDISRLATRPGSPTGAALITVAESGGDNTIVVAPGANATLSPADSDAARPAIAAADVLLMQLETPIETVARAAEIAQSAGVTVILNAAPAARLPATLLACIDVLIANETEAALLASSPEGRGAGVFAGGGGSVPTSLYPASSRTQPTSPPTSTVRSEATPDDLSSVLWRFASLGPTTTILTAGPNGALFAHARTDPGRVPACPVEPIDTVGAGDAFCGALATRLAEHQINSGRGGLDRLAVMDAVCWANAAGALATTKRGAIPSLPTRAEVLQLLRNRD